MTTRDLAYAVLFCAVVAAYWIAQGVRLWLKELAEMAGDNDFDDSHSGTLSRG